MRRVIGGGLVNPAREWAINIPILPIPNIWILGEKLPDDPLRECSDSIDEFWDMDSLGAIGSHQAWREEQLERHLEVSRPHLWGRNIRHLGHDKPTDRNSGCGDLRENSLIDVTEGLVPAAVRSSRRQKSVQGGA